LARPVATRSSSLPVADRHGFPGYFTVLVVGGLLPAVTFYPVARRFVNWRALSLTLFFMLLVSELWEATLGSPLRLVGLSAPADDWTVCRSLVRFAHRRSLCLDRSDLRDHNCL